MVIKIYKDKKEFRERKDKNVNGVHSDTIKIFSIRNKVTEEQALNLYIKSNKTNRGCWDCLDCINCKNCYTCHGCTNCKDCKECLRCEECVDSSACEDSKYLQSCSWFINKRRILFINERKYEQNKYFSKNLTKSLEGK